MSKTPSADTARVRVSAYHVTLDAFPRIFRDYTFNNAFFNTLKLGFFVGLVSVAVGLLFAYVDCYVKVRFRPMKKLFDVVSLLPVVSPPFVLSLSMILLFGKSGLVTRSLLGIYDSDIYGFWGILIVQGMTFFPVCYLMLKGLLNNIDCSMEEAARDMGASRFRVFMNVTLPLMLPGLGNAFLVTFIESVADFANPMLIGGNYDTLATTIYLRITGGTYDTNGAAAMAVVLLGITLILFFVQKYWLEKKTAATLTGKASRARMPIEDKSVRIPLSVFCTAVSAFVIMLYIAVPFGSLFNLWGRDYSLSFKWYEYMFKQDGLRAFKDSFILSLIASPVTALLSMIISYLVVKKKFKLKGFIEVVSMLAMAVPGTVLGVGFIRAFANGVFRTGFMQGFYGSGAILVVVFVVRSLPVGTRSGISALRQIDKSIEESAYDMGAGSGKVFTTVTLPLIKESFFSGLVTTFVRSITAISAIILLVTPQFLLITCRINEFAEKGSYGVACAYATILIIITYSAILLMNWLLRMLGTSKEQRRSVRQNNYYRKLREKANRASDPVRKEKLARKEQLAIDLNTLDDDCRTQLAAAKELLDQDTDLAAGDPALKQRAVSTYKEETARVKAFRRERAAEIKLAAKQAFTGPGSGPDQQ
ncbi:MAG: ABC transporter permease [Clostridiales bacterium]|nr:ABC transporter permease [Clostridiales bacterium]